MALSNSFPTIRPSLNLDFAAIKQLDPRITFTRASTATYYDGVTVAKAEENLLLHSEEFDNGIWLKSGLAITANDITAPDGTATADRLNATSGASFVNASQGTSVIANETCYVSAYIKAGTHDYASILVRFSNSGGGTIDNSAFYVTLSTGTISNASGSALISSSIEDVFGDGSWYRVSGEYLAPATSASVRVFLQITPNTATNNWGGTTTGAENIYFWGAQLEKRSSVTAYTPTTTQPITNYIPVLQSAASGVARFDHNPVTGESLGLLIEEQRTNLLRRSAEFDNAAWGKFQSTVASNTIIAPDGALTGDALVEDTSTGEHRITQTTGATLNVSNTISLFVKASPSGTTRNIRLLFGNNASTSNNVSCVFNNSSGVFSAGTPINSGTASGASASVTAVGNGWYRISLSGIADSGTGAGTAFVRINLNSGTNASYTGDGYSGLYIWGAQLEVGSSPTSYIPTVEAQVTRSADTASIQSIGSFFNNQQGTLMFETGTALPRLPTTSYPAFGFTDSTLGSLKTIQVFKAFSSDSFNALVRTDSGDVFASSAGALTNGALAPAKVALAYAVNNFATCANGGAVATDASGDLPTAAQLTALNIGSFNTTGRINGTVKKIAYYPQRLTNAQLQALTGV